MHADADDMHDVGGGKLRPLWERVNMGVLRLRSDVEVNGLNSASLCRIMFFAHWGICLCFSIVLDLTGEFRSVNYENPDGGISA